MNRELPQAGERWRHFKGAVYVIIAIAYDIASGRKYVIYSETENAQIDWTGGVRVFDRESDQVFWLKRAGSNPEFALYLLTLSKETWQESDQTDSTLWGRTLNNFMAVLSSRYGEQASNYQRFERVS